MDKEYEELIQPDNFVTQFKTVEEFSNWCKLGTKEDIQAAIKEFEKYELYEHCLVMYNIMKRK
jgi:hypothetical protein